MSDQPALYRIDREGAARPDGAPLNVAGNERLDKFIEYGVLVPVEPTDLWVIDNEPPFESVTDAAAHITIIGLISDGYLRPLGEPA